MSQDRTLELLQRRPRLEPQLPDQRRPGSPERLERFGLTSAPVERQHLLCPQPLSQRMLGNERLELRDQVAVLPGSEIGLEAPLKREQPQLLEARACSPREAGFRNVPEGCAAPELQRRAKALSDGGRVFSFRRGD